uniref:Importin N-terminal domain-containing protein n=1 Tax=Angiostrongylus cantonensis TaxID=6313 RepID=A0A0K0DMR0_ANGCA
LLLIVENGTRSNETRINAAWALKNMAGRTKEIIHIIVNQTIANILTERRQRESMELKYLLECVLKLIDGGLHDGTVPISAITLLTTSFTDLAKHYTEWTDIALFCLKALRLIAEDRQARTRTDVVLSEPGLLDLVFEILDSFLFKDPDVFEMLFEGAKSSCSEINQVN